MAFEVAYTTNFPGTGVSSWETGAWATIGTPTGEVFSNPGLTSTCGTAAGYVLPLPTIKVNPARDLIVELAVTSAASYYMGPLVADSTGMGAYSATWNSPYAALILQLTGYSYPGNFQVGAGFPSPPYRIRMNRIGGVYNVTYSTDDGATWSSPSGNIGVGSDTLSQVGIVMGAGGVSDQTYSFSEFTVWRDLPAAAPASPTGVVVTALGTAASVGWVPVDESDYYEYRVDGGSVIASPNVYVPTLSITGLTPSTSYTVEIRGVNSNGTGAWSALKTFTTPASTYYFDDFNRADSTTSLGTPVIGGAYTAQAGTWGINSNRAYTSTSTGAGHVTVDLGVTDYAFSAIIPVIGISSGLVFHWADANNFYLWHRTTTNIILYRRIAGTFNPLITTTIAGVANDKMMVVTKDDRIWLYLNDVLRSTANSDYPSTSIVGLYMSSSTAGRFDNALATTYETIPGGVDGGSGSILDSTSIITSTTQDALPGFVYKGRNTNVEDAVSGVA